jgi:stage III sporulation protein AG
MINLNKESSNKKKIENLVVLIIILIVTIIAINSIWNTESKTENSQQNISNKQLATTNSNEDDSTDNSDLDERLEKILKSIDGVGDVNVFINYSETSQVVAMYNENTKESSTEETDTSGGVRTIQEKDTQKEVIYNETSGEKTPVTEKVISPKIEGAIITAEGASNTNTKENIISAVEAVTGLATHKIQVFEMNKQY